MHSPFRYVPGLTVTYRPATDTTGSRWHAVIKRGPARADSYRATVPYQDGPDAAARAVIDRFNAALGADWTLLGAALSLDGGGSYAYPAGPVDVGPILSQPAP